MFRTFLGDATTSHVAIRMTTCFFFRNRPPGELPHQSCSTLRGEVDSSIPRVSGGLLVVVFEAQENLPVNDRNLAR